MGEKIISKGRKKREDNKTEVMGHAMIDWVDWWSRRKFQIYNSAPEVTIITR